MNTSKIPSSELPIYATKREGSSGLVSQSELTWALFAFVSGREDNRPNSGMTLLTHGIGLPDDEAELLFQHIRNSFDRVRQAMVMDVEATCMQRSELTTRQQLANKLTESGKNLDALRESFVFEIPQLVSPESDQKVTEWIDLHIRPSYVAVSLDYSQAVEVTDADPAELMARLCADNS